MIVSILLIIYRKQYQINKLSFLYEKQLKNLIYLNNVNI